MAGEPSFEFASAGRIVFGWGRLETLGKEARALGSRALVVFGRSSRARAPVMALLREAGVTVAAEGSVAGEPTVEQAVSLARAAADARCDLVIAVGGGSVIDAGKAAAALAVAEGEPLDYLEVVGRGRPLSVTPLLVVAVPTTAGTGAEVTRNAVLSVPNQEVKVSLRSVGMLPKLALVDPALTLDCPPALTAATGFDALAQVIEPFVSNAASPMTDALCRHAIPLAARALPRAWRHGTDRAARSDMAQVSLFGGLALANAKLGAVHGVAGPFGGMFGAPHGAVCAALLGPALELNVAALRARAPGSEALQRLSELAELLTGSSGAAPEEAANWCYALRRDLGVAGLDALGYRAERRDELVVKAMAASSMKGNPLPLEPAEIEALIERAR